MKTKQEVIERLKSLYEEGLVEENSEQCANLLSDLAKFFDDGEKWSYVCKCALLNGALLGSKNDTLKKNITERLRKIGKDLQNTYWQRSQRHRLRDFDAFEFSLVMKRTIEEKRDEIKDRLQSIDKICDVELEKDLIAKEEELVGAVRLIMREVTDFYASTMDTISKKCVEMLGDPPCQFSHFAMGSLAREEITLYSDFENAIILGEGVDWKDSDKREDAIEYFRWYAVLFDVILINFGETPISLIGIEGLNNHLSQNPSENWFKDIFITCGIMYDSCLPYASKNPFGRRPTTNKPEGTELILPVNDMLEYMNVQQSLKEGYHLTDMLLESRHVAGNPDLFHLFKSMRNKRANDLRKSVPYIKQDLACTKENLETFDLTPRFRTLGWSQHAKKSFYRPLSVHIPFLSRICGLFGYPNTSQIIENLQQFGLSKDIAHKLLYAISIAYLVRCRVYADRKKQSDVLTGGVYLINETSNIMNIFDAVGDRSTLDYYEIASNLRYAVTEIVEVMENKIRENDLGNSDALEFDSEFVITIFQKYLGKRGNYELFGDIYRHFQDYKKANECYTRALHEYRQTESANAREKECNLLVTLGLTNLYSLQFHDSLSWYKQLIDLEKKLNRGKTSMVNIATASTMCGQCVTEAPEFREYYDGFIKEAEDNWQTLITSDRENLEYVRGLADLRDTEAFYYLRTRDFEKSLKKYEESRSLFEKYYNHDIDTSPGLSIMGRGVANYDTLKVQNGIAMCLLHLKRYEESAAMFDEIIDLKRSMVGEKVADVTISWYLRHKAICLSNLGKYEEAVSTFTESFKVRSRAPGSQYDICTAIANTTRFLAECHMKFQCYEEAIESCKKVTEIVAKIPNSTRGQELKEIAEKTIMEATEKMKTC